MTRSLVGVRAIAQRPRQARQLAQTQPLDLPPLSDAAAAVLAGRWAAGTPPGSPLRRFAETGKVTPAVIRQLHRDYVRLSRATAGVEGEWVVQRLVRALLEYTEAVVHESRPGG